MEYHTASPDSNRILVFMPVSCGLDAAPVGGAGMVTGPANPGSPGRNPRRSFAPAGYGNLRDRSDLLGRIVALVIRHPGL